MGILCDTGQASIKNIRWALSRFGTNHCRFWTLQRYLTDIDSDDWNLVRAVVISLLVNSTTSTVHAVRTMTSSLRILENTVYHGSIVRLDATTVYSQHRTRSNLPPYLASQMMDMWDGRQCSCCYVHRNILRSSRKPSKYMMYHDEMVVSFQRRFLKVVFRRIQM